MEPTPRNITTFMFPTAIHTRNPQPETHIPQLNWYQSALNPKNRIDSLQPLSKSTWAIHGADLAGTRWFAVPNFAMGKAPLRIDVHIPEIFDEPGYLRDALSPNSSMFGELEDASRSSMAVHIVRALEFWSNRRKGMENEYLAMPFGSRIVFETLTADVRHMKIHLVPNYAIERQWLSLGTLKDTWKLSEDQWPSVVEFDKLRFRRQLHDTITVVSISGHDDRHFVFKSLMNDLKYFYHELKVLMTMPPHPNIIPRPIYLVTKNCGFGGRRGICGMILEYYPRGTLRRWLKDHRTTPCAEGSGTEISWAKQITSALMHIQEHGPGFYTNLKLDNIVLADTQDPLTPKVVMIDFEQRLGCPAWTPPEINSITFMYDLIQADPMSSFSVEYLDLFERCEITVPETERVIRYTNPPHGYCYPWLNLLPRERESAQVFMLGKLLWCILENSSLLNSYISINSFRDNYSDTIFPEFVRTSWHLRECILQCTAGSWELCERAPPLVAKGRKIGLRANRNDMGQDTLEDVQMAIRKWWHQQIIDSKLLLERHFNKTHTNWLQRPTLRDVLKTLEDTRV
ncbi:hypothetical protein F4778DRAFT_262868 [Xylariomycetidae sp. FL2044]|nr:hypothetical protein F4778DRAFT_262868 [Xylariomycetidae sp. FL2044]